MLFWLGLPAYVAGLGQMCSLVPIIVFAGEYVSVTRQTCE